MADKCIKCGRELTADERGLHRKLVNRGSTEYMCKTCLSSYFEISEEECDRLIEQFRAQGCMLFV